MKKPSVTGFVLAGGRSSRMGCDKAWLPLGPYSLIECVIERIRPHVERVVVIGNARNTQELRRLSVDAVLTDCRTGYGPLMGLYTGLMHSETAWNLFVSCDMPRLEPWAIERLLHACREDIDLVAFHVEPHSTKRDDPSLPRSTWGDTPPTQTHASIPGGMERVRLQPFPLVSHARAAVYLGRLLDRRQLALQELANLPTTRLLDLDAGVADSMLMNVNTLADYHALCDAFGMDVSVIGGR